MSGPSESRIPLHVVHDVFLRMAADTYPAGDQPEVLASGRKGYQRWEEGLRFVDSWSSEGEFSFGSTEIYWLERLVWRMAYQGYMKSEPGVAELLKAALLQNYARNIFYGGRGPRELPSDAPSGPHRLVYRNIVFGEGSFLSFSGIDYITRQSWPLERLYEHRYFGGLMVSVDLLS